MDLRLANINDLSKLKVVYGNIIDNMNKNNIEIWDEIYPCEFFLNDIEKNRLYVLTDGDEIVAVFVLCESNDGENNLKWKNAKEKALYIDRLGVNVNYLRQGIGGIIIKNAIEIAKGKNAKYLRLFVVDINKPAINLYLKNGFKQVDGIYEERIDDNFILREYGFEKEVNFSKG
ncbi:GNAT family N-acetyltransferase [Clostridium botulinum]|nr:GNAT family N-acetyltransferase [Clostridium botulinum]